MEQVLLILLILSLSTWIFIMVGRGVILRRIPRTGSYEPSVREELVSVIIPARNEEKNLPACIESLLKQRYTRLEVIVVDDNSSDRTSEVVTNYLGKGVKLVKLKDVEEGWQGKAYASHVGFLNSNGEWLLFMDADDILEDDSCLSKALNIASEHGAELITLYPRLRMSSPSLKATIPILLIALYFIGKPHKVAEGKTAFAFGSFTLIKRSAYERIGGHRAVRDAILEDKALANNAKKYGIRSLFVDGTESLSSSWNYDLGTLWSGILRLFIPLLMKSTIRKASTLFLLLSLLFLVPIISLAYSLLTSHAFLLVLSLATLFLIMLTIVIESIKHREGILPSILWPFGAAIIITAILVSTYMTYRGGVVKWRSRRYRLMMGEDREIAIPIS